MSHSTLYRSFAALVPLVVAASVVTGVSATASSGAPDLAPGSSNAAIAAAAPTSPSAAAERKSEVPQVVTSGQASRTGALPTTQMVRLALGLHPTNQGAEEAYLRAVQDKKSPQFHKFMTLEQWNANFAPTVADEQAVVSWAEAQGLTVTQRYSNRLIVDLEGNVSTVSKAFGVSMSSYRLGAQSFFSSDSAPVLPTTVSTAVASVSGLSNFGQLRPASPTLKEPTFSSYVAGPIRAAGHSAGADANPSAVAAMHKAVAAKRSTAAKAATGAKAGGTVSPSISGGAYDPTDIYSDQAYSVNAPERAGSLLQPDPRRRRHAAARPASRSRPPARRTVADMQRLPQHSTRTSPTHYTRVQHRRHRPACCDGEGTMDFEWATAMANSFGSFHDTSHVYMYDGVNAPSARSSTSGTRCSATAYARTMSSSWGCAEAVPATTPGNDEHRSRHLQLDARLRAGRCIGCSPTTRARTRTART